MTREAAYQVVQQIANDELEVPVAWKNLIEHIAKKVIDAAPADKKGGKKKVASLNYVRDVFIPTWE